MEYIAVNELYNLKRVPRNFKIKKKKTMSITNFVAEFKAKEKFDLSKIANNPYIKFRYGMAPAILKIKNITGMIWPGSDKSKPSDKTKPHGSLVLTAGKNYEQVLLFARIIQELISNVPKLKTVKNKDGEILDAYYKPMTDTITYTSIAITNICCEFTFHESYINFSDIIRVLTKINVRNAYQVEQFSSLRIWFNDGQTLKFFVSLFTTGSMIVVGLDSNNQISVAFDVIKIIIAASIENPDKRNSFIKEYIEMADGESSANITIYKEHEKRKILSFNDFL